MFTYRRLGAMGQLGNQLWQIAGTLGAAWRAGTDARFPLWEYVPYFNVAEEWFVEEVPTGPGVTDLSDDYLQDLANFAAFTAQIRHYFQPRESVRHQLIAEYGWFYEIQSPVALHVRRGDYLGAPTRFPVLDIDYYRRAVALMSTLHPGARFVVFSDDIAWCRRVFPAGFSFVDGEPRALSPAGRRRQGPPHDHLDLFLMAQCHGHIIANSSFSWWGAFLSGDAQACYPTVWYGPDLQDIEWRRMIPDGWIAV